MKISSIELSPVGVEDGGCIKANIIGWDGVIFRIPADMMSKLKDQAALKYCGIYFLFGHTGNKNSEIVYVGQVNKRQNDEETLRRRWLEHRKNKKWCEEVLFFTTQGDTLGSTELDYLEYRFCGLASEAGRYIVDNEKVPNKGNPRNKQEMLDNSIEFVKVIIRALGHRVFEKRAEQPQGSEVKPKPKPKIPPVPPRRTKLFFTRQVKAAGETIKAQALLTDHGIVVLKGSQVLMSNRPGLLANTQKLREHLKRSGSLIKFHGDVYTLKKDQIFSSPSTAGSFVLGASVNGRLAWKSQDGKTFDQLEKEKLSATTKSNNSFQK